MAQEREILSTQLLLMAIRKTASDSTRAAVLQMVHLDASRRIVDANRGDTTGCEGAKKSVLGGVARDVRTGKAGLREGFHFVDDLAIGSEGFESHKAAAIGPHGARMGRKSAKRIGVKCECQRTTAPVGVTGSGQFDATVVRSPPPETISAASCATVLDSSSEQAAIPNATNHPMQSPRNVRMEMFMSQPIHPSRLDCPHGATR